MKKIKSILMTAAALSLTAVIAHATVGTRDAVLSYDNLKIVLDGREITPVGADGNTIEPFIIDGTTYLPIRGISSVLGLNVGWNGETKTIELNTPGAFSGAVQVYDDSKVTIEFAGCTKEKPYSWAAEEYYYANFNIKNKTDNELTFQPDSISFNGLSYSSFIGSEKVAPKSTGKVSFYTKTEIPTAGISKTSGQISVIDFSAEILSGDYSYDAKWVDITQ